MYIRLNDDNNTYTYVKDNGEWWLLTHDIGGADLVKIDDDTKSLINKYLRKKKLERIELETKKIN